jgi:hypothetical protein
MSEHPWVGRDAGVVEISGPIESILWLAVLVDDGPMGVCISCAHLSSWRHPVYGPVHPQCIGRVVTRFDAQGPVSSEPAPVRSASRRRGAYSRRGVA